jgi:hypothetical protein
MSPKTRTSTVGISRCFWPPLMIPGRCAMRRAKPNEAGFDVGASSSIRVIRHGGPRPVRKRRGSRSRSWSSRPQTGTPDPELGKLRADTDEFGYATTLCRHGRDRLVTSVDRRVLGGSNPGRGEPNLNHWRKPPEVVLARALAGDAVGSTSLNPLIAWRDQSAILPSTDCVGAHAESSRFAHPTGISVRWSRVRAIRSNPRNPARSARRMRGPPSPESRCWAGAARSRDD